MARKQPIKYWSTEVSPLKTANELVTILVAAGATSTTIEWEAGIPVGVHFRIKGPKRGELPVRLRARTEEVVRLLRRSGVTHQKAVERAPKIVWRHLKDLIEQQLLAVRLGQYELAETFLAGVEVDVDGRAGTFGEWMDRALPATPRSSNGALQLPVPPAAE